MYFSGWIICSYWGQKLQNKVSQSKTFPVSTAFLALYIYKTCFATCSTKVTENEFCCFKYSKRRFRLTWRAQNWIACTYFVPPTFELVKLCDHENWVQYGRQKKNRVHVIKSICTQGTLLILLGGHPIRSSDFFFFWIVQKWISAKHVPVSYAHVQLCAGFSILGRESVLKITHSDMS